MSLNKKLLETIIQHSKSSNLKCVLNFNTKKIPLTSVQIIKSDTPVNKPTIRGGVYFSDKEAYKIIGKTSDLSIIPMLSGAMLGPNTEFQRLEINSTWDDNTRGAVLVVNLTNTAQKSSELELYFVIIEAESI